MSHVLWSMDLWHSRLPPCCWLEVSVSWEFPGSSSKSSRSSPWSWAGGLSNSMSMSSKSSRIRRPLLLREVPREKLNSLFSLLDDFPCRAKFEFYRKGSLDSSQRGSTKWSRQKSVKRRSHSHWNQTVPPPRLTRNITTPAT